MLRVKVLYLKGLKKSHKISRLLQIAIAITLMIGLVQLWQTSLLQGQLLLKTQTQKMARLLVQQTAYGAAPALQLQNDEQLQWLASALVEDPKVMSAAIFSEQGIRLSFAQSLTKEELDPDSAEMAQLLSKYPPYVEPVLQDGKNLGYVEVRLDSKLFFNEIKEAHILNMEQQQIMLLVAGLIGLLLSRAMSFKRADFDRRRTRVKLRKNPPKKAKKDTKLAVQVDEHSENKQHSVNEENASSTEISSENTDTAPEQDTESLVQDTTSEPIDATVATDTVTDAVNSRKETDTSSTEPSQVLAPKTSRKRTAKKAVTADTQSDDIADVKAAIQQMTISAETQDAVAPSETKTQTKPASKTEDHATSQATNGVTTEPQVELKNSQTEADASAVTETDASAVTETPIAEAKVKAKPKPVRNIKHPPKEVAAVTTPKPKPKRATTRKPAASKTAKDANAQESSSIKLDDEDKTG